MTHLNLDERLALIEATDEPTHPHLGACARCRAEVQAGRAALAEATSVSVPEPSPLFWDALSRRVSERLGAEDSPRAPLGWRFWRVLVPLAVAVGALVIAVGIDRAASPRLPGPPPAAVAVNGEAEAATTPGLEDEWAVLANVAGEFDLDTLADSLGRTGQGAADNAMWDLTERERIELAALLRAELQQ
jgi:hypothetical protein